ncbi:MAG TPA: MFS transporter [Clostridiales bacterium]|nr:MFS transporter [Clostridiales bacterium]
MKLKNPNLQKWVTLFVVAIAGGVITKLPYLRETYYAPLQEATGSTNTQLGLLMSAYGIVNFICYFPGGILADKFSAKKLIAVACLGTAAAGFWYATLPSYFSLVVIHMIFAITTVFIFWAAMVKVVNNLGPAEEQGRLFGTLEGGRGLIGTIAAFGSVAVFARFADDVGGLKGTIVYYSVLLVIAGILAAIFIPEPEKTNDPKEVKASSGSSLKWADFVAVAKIPRVWLCGVLVVANYAALIFHGYVTPYLSAAFDISSSTVATLSVVRTYMMMMLGAAAAGFFADKMGSRIKFMKYGFYGMFIFSIFYLLIPANRNAVWLIVLNFIIYGFCLYSVKALYFSTIDEVLIPKKLAGTASGVISLVGYAPEIFLYTVSGNIVDNGVGLSGYRTCFVWMVILAAIGAASAILLLKLNAKAIKEAQLESAQ